LKNNWIYLLPMLVVGLSACEQQASFQPDHSSTVTLVAQPDGSTTTPAEKAALVEDCKSTIGDKTAKYEAEMRDKKYWMASINLRDCADVMHDSGLQKLVADAEVKSYVQDIVSPKSSGFDRVASLEKLIRDYPEQSKKYIKLHDQIVQKANEQDRQYKREHRFDSAPQIGATTDQVMSNGWGYPDHINKTTTASGIKEQWVYGSNKYLYFQDGVLTAIQE
jgi:hypothetical protein